MAKCPVCGNKNNAENIFCGRCGCRLGQEDDSHTVLLNIDRDFTKRLKHTAANKLTQMKQQWEKVNFKAVLGPLGLLLLLFTVGFGLANSAMFLTLGIRPTTPAAVNDNNSTQPERADIPAEDNDQETNIPVATKAPAITGKEKEELKKPAYETYTNEQFGFSIDYPTDFQKEEQSAGSNGIVYASPDGQAKIMAFGSNKPKGSSLKDIYREQKKIARTKIAYEKVGSSYFVLSWEKDNMVYYLKTFVGQSSTSTFVITYPRDEKEHYEPINIRLEASFKSGVY